MLAAVLQILLRARNIHSAEDIIGVDDVQLIEHNDSDRDQFVRKPAAVVTEIRRAEPSYGASTEHLSAKEFPVANNKFGMPARMNSVIRPQIRKPSVRPSLHYTSKNAYRQRWVAWTGVANDTDPFQRFEFLFERSKKSAGTECPTYILERVSSEIIREHPAVASLHSSKSE